MSKFEDLKFSLKSKWQALTKQEKTSFLIIPVLLLVLPIALAGVLTVKSLRSKAAPAPVTPPITPPTIYPSPTATPISITPKPSLPPTSTPIATIISGTPTPTAIAIATSSPISTAISTMTAIPMPTNSPTPNKKPVITTSVLQMAKVDSNYNAVISGYDLNGFDKLKLSATGWPRGIENQKCYSYLLKDRTTIQCLYSGKPIKSGFYNIAITLSDSSGNTVKKNITLFVLPKFWFW